METRDKLLYISSFIMLMALFGIVAYFTFIPVPMGNKDIIITILGVILGGGAAAMPNLFGGKDSETNKLRDRIISLETHLATVTAQYKDVSDRYETVIGMLVNRHFIPSNPNLPPMLPTEMKRFTGEQKCLIFLNK